MGLLCAALFAFLISLVNDVLPSLLPNIQRGTGQDGSINHRINVECPRLRQRKSLNLPQVGVIGGGAKLNLSVDGYSGGRNHVLPVRINNMHLKNMVTRIIMLHPNLGDHDTSGVLRRKLRCVEAIERPKKAQLAVVDVCGVGDSEDFCMHVFLANVERTHRQ
jgi:hypothetical protein